MIDSPSGPFQKTADHVYNIISARILDGTLAPKSKLSLRKMAGLARVSVIPVIEALNRLAADGLVESRPQWGFFVASPDMNQMRDRLMLREAVECQVARLLNRNLKLIERMRLIRAARELDTMTDAFKESETHSEHRVEESHYRFHLLMAELTGFDSLVGALRQINLPFLLLKADTLGRKHPLPAGWHSLLVSKILNGTPTFAEAAMRLHVQNSYKVILNNTKT